MNLFVTGAYGFIGSNFVPIAVEHGHKVVAYDSMTYAANPLSLLGVDPEKLVSIRGDIRDALLLDRALSDGLRGAAIDVIVNFAAESHVDRSISNAMPFVETNILGPTILMEAARRNGVSLFVQISTDEVYGSVEPDLSSSTNDVLNPSSAYAASKAAADLMLLSYQKTHGYDLRITRCTNNYGPYQHREKFIPTVITKALGGQEIPIYGDGTQCRDWIFVADHCRGILRSIELGHPGGIYHFGGPRAAANEMPIEITNLELAELILATLREKVPHSELLAKAKVRHISDRLGHDRRYSLDWSASEQELDWQPCVSLRDGIRDTVDWYFEHLADPSFTEHQGDESHD